MRKSIEKWLQDVWYSNTTPPWYLRMLEPLYRAGYKFDHRKSNHLSANSENSKGTHSGTPLWVVGNITVGGSGKTPLVITLCNIARELGVKVGVASTGYGRKSSGTLRVDANSDTTECGDEPVLIARRTGFPVIVAERRAEAVNELDKMNLDLIISDDGLQTAGLRRDIEICVIDGSRGIGNEYLLPAGPLREPTERLQQVDRIISNGEWPSKPAGLNISRMDLVAEQLCSIDGKQKFQMAEFFSDCRDHSASNELHLFAAIGNPERFFKSVRELEQASSKDTSKVEVWHEHRFADHHTYQAADFDGVPDGATIVMTEKDAVKCRKLNLVNAWYLPVYAELDKDFVQWFCQKLKSLDQDEF